MGDLLRAIDAYARHGVTRIALQISPQVMARPGELRKAVWSEFDLENAVWRIPAERMKMRRPHAVPLSRQVLALLQELLPLTGPEGYVFPAHHTSRRPLSENTINQAMRAKNGARTRLNVRLPMQTRIQFAEFTTEGNTGRSTLPCINGGAIIWKY
ncbi:integrase [Novosphingobium sediminicola]|uniref:Integrase n=1 Tax=Novosphingobium sediminicola TaxID=563162 RepID=A0A7W6CTK4_9SPHN|nr:integrase [Novosphingobium sediminicola]